MNTINDSEILKWFTGKPLENARAALALLNQSAAQGFWLPGASRKVQAALSKSNVAAKLARENEGWMGYLGLGESEARYNSEENSPSRMGRRLWFSASHGLFGHAREIDFDKLRAVASGEHSKILDVFASWVEAFRPVANLIDDLDRTRPKPVITSLGVSPTVTKTLVDAGLNLDSSTVRVCPVEWGKIEREESGRKMVAWVGKLLWPEGTVHESSRFSQINSRNRGANAQCHACGHAIRDTFNWVPLLLDSKDGVPHSLWVGRDCARKIFGIEVSEKMCLE